MPIDPATLDQINSAIFDIQSSDYNNFDKHIKKLSRLLHSTELDPITNALTTGLDLDAWISAGLATQGGMIGSATLEWPAEPEKELGIIILLIDRFADKGANDALNFAHTFYYNGSNINSNLQSLTRQVFIPFARDYINYVKKKIGTAKMGVLPTGTGMPLKKVFVVHGHDDGPKYAVTRYLEKLGLEAIILHERASQGKTIIEKIEAHSDVGFAVVLLTPDDFGGARGEEPKDRARQNVILELGFFVGKLTRSRVCALKRGDIEVPSDFGGVVYVTYDESSAWQKELGGELEAAGFNIDWNQVMRSS